MKEKRIEIGLKNMYGFSQTLFFAAVFILFFSQIASADIYHYKNFLVGDRASLMGGAYSAVADDAAGAYYNPAGISFSFGDSVSGSGNAYHKVNTRYKQAIGSNDWTRESDAILPNFFGLIKKYGNSAFAISYIVPETMIEHQDQAFDSPNNYVDRYYISLHSEDHVYMLGPSYAYKLSETLSLGVTLYYYYREFRLQQNQYSDYSASYSFAPNGQRELYLSQRKIEKGFTPRIGLQWSPSNQLVVGLMGSQTSLLESLQTDHQSYVLAIPGNNIYYDHTKTDNRELLVYPTQITLGVAYYPSPYLLVSGDLDYYISNENATQNVMNLALGGEWFLDTKNAIRAGVFTNNDSRKEVTSSTVANEHIDLTGISFGYSSYSRSSSVTIGMVYQSGTGKSQITGTSTIKDMERTSMTMVFAATYNY